MNRAEPYKRHSARTVTAYATSALKFADNLLKAAVWQWLLVLAAGALIVRLPLLLNDFATSPTGDTPGYLQISTDLLSGNGFTTETYRTAGYPLYLAALSLVPGGTISAVVVVQHLLGIALVVGVFLTGDRFFGRIPAVFGASMVAFAPPIMLVEHWVLPDLLFGMLVMAGAVALAQGVLPERPSIRCLVLAGGLFGLATHVKPSGQVLIAVAPLVLLFATHSWRETLRGSLATAGAMVIVISPWIAHNAIKYGHPIISSQGGSTLWLRAFDQDHLRIPTDTEDGRFVKRAYDGYINSLPPGSATDRTGSYNPVFLALMRRGESVYSAAKIQGTVAAKAIRSQPRVYLEGTWRNVRQYVTYSHQFDEAEFYATINLEHATGGVIPVSKLGWRVANVLGWLGWVFSLALLGVVALLFAGDRRTRVGAAAFAVTWIAIVVGGSLTNWSEPRFAAQVAPLQWLLEGAAAVLVIGAIGARWRATR